MKDCQESLVIVLCQYIFYAFVFCRHISIMFHCILSSIDHVYHIIVDCIFNICWRITEYLLTKSWSPLSTSKLRCIQQTNVFSSCFSSPPHSFHVFAPSHIVSHVPFLSYFSCDVPGRQVSVRWWYLYRELPKVWQSSGLSWGRGWGELP